MQKGSCLTVFQVEMRVCSYRGLLQETTNRNVVVVWPKESCICTVAKKIHTKASLKLSEGKGLAYLINTQWDSGFQKGWLVIFNQTFPSHPQE